MIEDYSVDLGMRMSDTSQSNNLGLRKSRQRVTGDNAAEADLRRHRTIAIGRFRSAKKPPAPARALHRCPNVVLLLGIIHEPFPRLDAHAVQLSADPLMV